MDEAGLVDEAGPVAVPSRAVASSQSNINKSIKQHPKIAKAKLVDEEGPVAVPSRAVASSQAISPARPGPERREAVSPGKHASAANLVVHELMDTPQQRPLHEAAVQWLRPLPTRLESEFRTAMQAPVQWV